MMGNLDDRGAPDPKKLDIGLENVDQQLDQQHQLDQQQQQQETTSTVQHIKTFAFDDTISARFYGRRSNSQTKALSVFVEVSTLGVAHLLARWFPSVDKHLTTDECPLAECTHVFVVNSFGQSELIPTDTEPVSEALYECFLEECAKASRPQDFCIPAAQCRHKNVIVSLDYRCNRFILNPLTGLFMSIHDLPRVLSSDVDTCEEGLKTDQQVAIQRVLFGKNEIGVGAKSIGQLLVDEVLHPFNIFQIFSVIVWSCEDYYYYALIILLMTGGSIAITLYETFENQRKLEAMARFSCQVRVLREQQWTVCSSEDLVPGDVIDLEDMSTLPCDLILLNGDAVVDESMLTGETVPLTKAAVSYEEFRDFYATNRHGPSYTLFSGTRLLRSRPRHGRPAAGLVLNTGFLTAKGTLIQSILFPRPNKFRFYRDSMVFVGFLGAIAMVGFIFGIVIMRRLGYDWVYIVTRALDVITVVVPPALPATMSVGAIFALNRLKSREIFCISPPRINVCAKVGLMCFDKTGTLTEEGLDVLGVVPVHHDPDGKASLLQPVAPLMKITPSVSQQCRPLVQLMATCHSIQSINDALVGDPLDLKMFAFSNWILEEAADDVNEAIVPVIIRPPGSESFDLDDAINSSDGSDPDEPVAVGAFEEMGVIRCFEFNATIRRMSVIVRELESERMMVMTKGSPETIKAICTPASLPDDYDQTLARYSHAGYRVIACAYKPLPTGTTWLKVQRMLREQVEQDLLFLGFLLFENKLKEQTTPIIKALSVAGIQTVMVTGDNLYTAVAVARACGMISPDTEVLVPVEDSADAGGRWESLDTGCQTASDNDLLPSTNTIKLQRQYSLAMTGAAFDRYLQSYSFDTLRAVISKCRVFARMSPQQKQSLVELFQSYNVTVGFCGDGANDCGALKAADVGVSLSAAEASVAAPFTSRQQHIGCIMELLREGRAALATSFSCFKFMALYSMIQFTTLTLMYLFRTSLTDGQFIYIDVMLIIPFGVLLSRFGPAPIVHPTQPTARLISTPVLSSIIGQVLLQFVVQVSVAVIIAARFSFTDLTSDVPSQTGNIALFLSSIFLYSTVALVFSFGHPHRQRFFWPFTVFLVFTFLLAVWLCLFRVSWLDWCLTLDDFVTSDGWMCLGFGVGHLILSVLYDMALVPWLSAVIKARQFGSQRRRIPV